MCDVVALPVGILSIIATRVEREDLFQDLEVVRNVEAIPAVFMAEEVVKVVIPTPSDGRKAQ